VAAVSTGDKWEALERWQRETGASYPIFLDDGHAARAFGVSSSPTCILVRPGGTIAYRGTKPPEDWR
jgi:hypothetical protein